MQLTPEQEAFQWQVGVWDRISHLYFREVDPRFASVVASTIKRADPKPGEKQAADYISLLDELWA